jgi:ribonucrease Y
MDLIIPILIGLVMLVVGFVVATAIQKRRNAAKLGEADRRADSIISDARKTASKTVEDANHEAKRLIKKAEEKNEEIKRKKILEAKERYIKLKADFEEDVSERKIKIKEAEIVMRDSENSLNQKLQSFQDKQNKLNEESKDLAERQKEVEEIKENLNKQHEILNKKRKQLEAASEEHINALEKIAKLTEQDAKEELLKAVKEKAHNDAVLLNREIIENARASANKDAKKIVIETIQRMCAEYTIENTVSVFHLESDDQKGQIIGREGRNIRALEAATGAELVVDDTPEAIVISSFDPIRRELCRQALKKLTADGRIHPARIEEVCEKTRKELEDDIREIGERTVIDLDIHGLNPALVRMVGRMRFRSSYGQNLLKHSIETANLCATMAAELGLPPKLIKLAKRAGLLHDIGKVSDEDSELSHALWGMKLCQKHNENPAVINAIGAHHDEVEMTSIISPIVQACDAISGSRPGARREILESYLKRITDLEEIALGYEGVQKVYAMQAGRELRVIVESEKVSDDRADQLSFVIAEKIQDEMQYPGQIKVTVIREKRATSFAR